MPETVVVTPAAVVPADRLTLGTTDARSCPSTPSSYCGGDLFVACATCSCMAEE